MNSKKIFVFIKAFRKKFNEVGIYKESAALTFVTLLGFIPFIIFLLFFLPELPFLKMGSKFGSILETIFIPESAQQIAQYISEIANQKISFNLFSFTVLLVTSYSLFKIINSSFDDILNVHETRKRGILYNFVKFFGMTIFGSLLILILLSTASMPIFSKFIKFPLLQGVFLYLTPFLILFIIFSLGFAFIPTIKINSRSIFIGSAVSAIFWIFFKLIFNWYIFTFTNTALIFGLFASIPIFFFWIYANWIIMLCGVIIVSILEGRDKIPEFADQDLQTVKITFEKLVNNENVNGFQKTTLERTELKEIIKEILEGDKEESQEEDKKEFTEIEE
ncbi:MAG: YihY family inner membrane protein [Candidatus Cloacimonetes bacterium]|jgi:membrane protein|nr:YihY family inner membrane protein [Candidatus Cloacimonadota bacterium]MBT6994064.1 YihY family inner membrane protein [Candidatus Cloacimonadota bacterium]MBT7468911.1 YihY family inner membrane protein [Candidatus Cloacimonadota bacterium]